MGGLSKGRGDCAGTRPSSGSGVGGWSVAEASGHAGLASPCCPSGRHSALRCSSKQEDQLGLHSFSFGLGGWPRWARLSAGARRGVVGGTAAPCPWRPSQPSSHGGPAVGLLQVGALPLRLACHVLGGSLVTHGHTWSSPPAGNSKQLQLKVPASCWLAFLEEQRPVRSRQTTTPTTVGVLHWNASPARTSCPNALCTQHALGLLTPPANHVSSQAPRHAAKRSPTGPRAQELGPLLAQEGEG